MSRPLRVLHLEDDPVDAELVQAALREAGFDCEFERVETREQFQSALDRGRSDLILADFTLPGFDGMSALRIASDRCPAEVPFIFVSGTLGEEIATEAIKMGAVDYVVKNRLDRLPHAVRRALREVDERRHRRGAEQALRESEQRFRTLTEAVPQIIWSARADGTVEYINRRWTEYTGRPVEQSLDWAWQAASHPDDLERVTRLWTEAVRSGEPHRIEHRLRRQDGEFRWFLTSALPVRDGAGVIARWLGSSTDIHDQKLAQEQLKQINELLEARVEERTHSLIEHQEQLRAMTSDLTLTEQRERRRLASELHDYLAQLLVACKMKTRLLAQLTRSTRGESVIDEINDLLEQSIKYTRTLIAELSPTILYEAGLVAAVHWLAEQMQRHGLRVTVHEDDVNVRMPDDQAVLVFQTIRELLINVAKHAMVHEATVILEQSEPCELKVSVVDQGVGFDLSSADGPTSIGRYGLFSIRERLDALGGRFEVQTAPGQGTRAAFRVPVERPREEEPDSASSSRAGDDAAPPAGTRPAANRRRVTRVLLADDHHMVREGLRSIIENEPRLRVVGEASNGEEALQQTRVLHPDVVVMDINMPKMNGIEATRRIREEMPGVAVIALSMHEDRSMIAAMREAGAIAYIPKGGASDDLSRAIREAHCTFLSDAGSPVEPFSGNP
jgi:PAS domain S-box-containing protein